MDPNNWSASGSVYVYAVRIRQELCCLALAEIFFLEDLLSGNLDCRQNESSVTQRSKQKKKPGCFWAEDRLMDEGNAPVNIHGPRDQEVHLEAWTL